MIRRGALAGCVVALALLGWPRPARAVVRVDFTVSKICKASKTVVLGKVAATSPSNRVVDVDVTATLKGASPGPRLRVQVATPPDVFPKVAVDKPVVLFLAQDRGAPVAIVHIADTWLFARGLPGASKPSWRVVGPYDGARSFPGRTLALGRLVRAIAAGKDGPKGESYPDAFLGGIRKVADLGVAATDLLALDLTEDGRTDILAFTQRGIRVFAAKGDSFVDAREALGLAEAEGQRGAVGDLTGDGKVDLLLGRTLWHRGEDRFVQAGDPLDLPPPASWAAAALDDVTGNGYPEVVVLLKTGTLLILEAHVGGGWKRTSRSLWKGPTAQAAAFSRDWSDDGTLHVLVAGDGGITRYGCGTQAGQPAAFGRLTGARSSSFAALRAPAVLAVPLDYDGNGRMDFLVITETGGLALINRGFGAFLPSVEVHARLSKAAASAPGLKFVAGTVAAAIRGPADKPAPQNLFLLSPSGSLFEAMQRGQ